MRYVIGAGINGLILAYTVGATAIGTDEESQTKSNFQLGPRILHADRYSCKMLGRLGIYRTPDKFRVGHYRGLQMITPDAQFKRDYVLKTRGVNIPINSAMSGDKLWVHGWDISEIGLVEALESKVSCIHGMVTKVSTAKHEITIEDNVKLPYGQLFSTIKLPILLKIMGLNSLFAGELNAAPVSFIKAHNGWPEKYGNRYSYVYFCEARIPFNRCTYLKDGSYVLEVPGREIPYTYFEDNGIVVEEVKTVENCQLLPPYNYFETLFGVKLVGRYGQWNHNRLINDVIKAGYGIWEKE